MAEPEVAHATVEAAEAAVADLLGKDEDTEDVEVDVKEEPDASSLEVGEDFVNEEPEAASGEGASAADMEQTADADVAATSLAAEHVLFAFVFVLRARSRAYAHPARKLIGYSVGVSDS